MATDKERTGFAEEIAKHSDLSVNAVLRVFFSLNEHGVDVMSADFKRVSPAKTPKKSEAAKVTRTATVPAKASKSA